MALMRAHDVPEDAVEISETEAKLYAWDLISNWKSSSDTWALLYGPGILGGINAFSGMAINSHYRKKLKLGTYGYLSSVIPICVMPGILTALFHRYLISTEMLLMRNDSCPMCYELRSSLVQLGFGVGYPMVLGTLSALMFANRYSTYRVPNLGEGPKVMFTFLRKMTRPFNGMLTFIATVQVVASSAVTYFEMRNNFTVRKKVIELENKLMAEQEIKPIEE